MLERYIEADDAKIWTKKSGNGVPVLLLSGGPGTYNYLQPVAELIENDCEVIMFDPRGCGRSTEDEAGYGLEKALQDIETVRIAYGVEKWGVIGHSWGADLGLAYSLMYPQSVTGYVSIAGTGVQNDRDWKEAYSRNKEIIGEKLPFFEFKHNKTVHRSLINSWRTFIKRPNVLLELSQMDIPALFICAEKDIRPSWPIKQIAKLVKDAEYLEILDAEHYIWLFKKDELQEVLIDFLSRFK